MGPLSFRYLILLPFSSHGSVPMRYECEELIDGFRSRVFPRLPLSDLDLRLLGKAFQAIPSLLNRKPDIFRLVDNFGVEYECYTPHSHYRALLIDDTYEAWQRARNTARYAIYANLRVLYDALQGGVLPVIHSVVNQFYSEAPSLLTPIMASVYVDEPVLESYDLLSSVIPSTQQHTVQSAVFTNPFTMAWSNESVTHTNKKRITTGWNEGYYLATQHASDLDEIHVRQSKFEIQLLSLGVSENLVKALRRVREMVLCTEELHYLWGSVATLLSSAITRLHTSRGSDIVLFSS
jgi:hypothetical protein